MFRCKVVEIFIFSYGVFLVLVRSLYRAYYRNKKREGTFETKKDSIRNKPYRVFEFYVIPERFERSTDALEGRCSIQLSYGTSTNSGTKVVLIFKFASFFEVIFLKWVSYRKVPSKIASKVGMCNRPLLTSCFLWIKGFKPCIEAKEKEIKVNA